MSERRGGGGQSKNSELDRWCCSSENHGKVSPNRLLFFPLPMKTLIQLTIPQSLAIDASIIFDQSGLKTLKYRKKEADFRYVFRCDANLIHSFIFVFPSRIRKEDRLRREKTVISLWPFLLLLFLMMMTFWQKFQRRERKKKKRGDNDGRRNEISWEKETTEVGIAGD